VVEEYITPGGRNLALHFVTGLAGRNKAEAIALLELLEERGNTLGLPHSKALGGGLFELRGQEVRLFYTFRPGRRITLLDGMIEKRGDIPPKVLERLRGFVAQVKARDAKADGGVAGRKT
jgi:hypothetical protein